jgi:hypothetical protein
VARSLSVPSAISGAFGSACFFLKGVAPDDISMEEIFAACWPWIGLQVIALIFVMAFPDIALWLPCVARCDTSKLNYDPIAAANSVMPAKAGTHPRFRAGAAR